MVYGSTRRTRKTSIKNPIHQRWSDVRISCLFVLQSQYSFLFCIASADAVTPTDPAMHLLWSSYLCISPFVYGRSLLYRYGATCRSCSCAGRCRSSSGPVPVLSCVQMSYSTRDVDRQLPRTSAPCADVVLSCEAPSQIVDVM